VPNSGGATPGRIRQGVPQEVAAINREIRRFMDTADDTGKKIGNYKCGVYAFFDYDEEPIYVGQTVEQIRTRIGRHLTGQRSDAVAKSILDPFEVAYIELYPFPDLQSQSAAAVAQTVARAEYTLYLDVLQRSHPKAVLNEKEVASADIIALPRMYRARIVPDEVFALRSHPDIRIARRANTVATLARIISERQVDPGIRRTLLVQAQRIELLAERRLNEFSVVPAAVEEPGENTGDDSELV